MTELSSDTLHASCVAIDGVAVLLAGRSGTGKSDLALRLIDRGAALVSDDYTAVRRRDGRLWAIAPATIAGKIEVRGVGIVALPPAPEAEVLLYIDLEAPVARMPEPATRRIAGVTLPLAAVAPFEISAPIKVEMLLRGDPRVTAQRVLLVTGLSGAGKSTALRTLEDIGWEVVDNLPLGLLDRLLAAPTGPAGAEDRPLALGIDSRTRGFDPGAIVERVARRRALGEPTGILFLDCTGAVLVRRFSETRRRHPLALDRPAEDGIAQERGLLEPLRRAADHLIDTTDLNSNALQKDLRGRFAVDEGAATLAIMSFSFARGVPRNADLMFDMRFLRNPHWDPALRPKTGLDADVAAYVAADPTYAESQDRIVDLLALLLPRYAAEGKSYVTVAFGCTGGKHRSVHSAERVAQRLQARGFSPTIVHRDLPPHGRG